MVQQMLGFTRERRLPLLSPRSLESWLRKNDYLGQAGKEKTSGLREVCLFIDEFTDFLDAEKGIAAVKLLRGLGYPVAFSPALESGRTYISKGLLRKARKIANRNIKIFSDNISEDRPLVGIEPSAILAFRDEYPELVSQELRQEARRLSKSCLTLEEFIASEFSAGNIHRNSFTTEKKHIKLHGHCQQKAIASTAATKTMLSIPANYTVEEIKSGCCGMAGAFGYEKRHYELSMKIGELVLFPAIRNSETGTLISAPGTSCRQQILDGTGVQALHPVEILYQALV
jgi:Fe-S oxidoreductase